MGGIVWAVIYGVGDSFFGSALKRLQTPADVVLAVIAIAVFIAGIVVPRRKENGLGDKAERPYPDGPAGPEVSGRRT